MNTETARLLDELGLVIGPSGARLVDENAASGYIHHSREPVALVGYALTAPDLARATFPKYTFIDLIRKAPALDSVECAALAALCGADDGRTYAKRDPQAFGQMVLQVIDRYDLDPFFFRTERRYGREGDHFSIRPRGTDDCDYSIIPDDLKAWKAAYRAATPLRQVMTTTVLHLYNQEATKQWMARLKKDWHAAEGIEILRAEAALEDWGRLYALYSGW